VPDNEKKNKLTDFIDIEFLQEFQDFFAKTMDVASITVDDTGPITQPSNFTDFCIKYTRGSELGYNRCNACDIKWGKLAAEKGEPVIYPCHSGLTDFAVPIIIEGEHIASILAGQVLTEPPNEEHFRELARELGINEDEYIDAVRKIKIVPIEKIKVAADFIYFVANSISAIGLKNYQLYKKSQREKLYREITETIRSTLEISDIKQLIVNSVGSLLDTDRCFIMEYNQIIDDFLPVEFEYLSSSRIKSYKGIDVNVDVPEFALLLKQGQQIVINHKDVWINGVKKPADTEKEAIDRHDVKSAFSVPLYYGNELLGALAVHYVRESHHITDDEINQINIFSNQISIALHQAMLYKQTKLLAEREAFLRRIVEKLQGSLDIEEILSYICEQTSILFNVQRTAIAVFPNQDNYEEYILRKEYKSDEKIIGVAQVDDFSKVAAYFGVLIKKSNDFISIENIPESDTPDYFKAVYIQMGVKSLIGTAISKGENVWGTLVLSDYNEHRKWTDDEKNMLKTISNQVYIALNHAELFNKFKQTTANQNAILNNMPFMAWLKDKKSRLLAANEAYAETTGLTLENIIGKTDFDFYPKNMAQKYVDDDGLVIETKKPFNSEELIIGTKGARLHETFKSPVFDEKGNVIGTVGLARDITDRKDAELELIRRQEQIIKSAERENFIGNIVLKAIRTFDMNGIKAIVKDVGEITAADRCYFVEIDLEKMKGVAINYEGEYLASPEIKSIIGYEFPTEEVSKFIEIFLETKDLSVFDYEEILKDMSGEFEGPKKYANRFELKNSVAIPFYYRDKLTAALVIEYVKEKVTPDVETVEFLKILGNQTGIAFSQIKLFNEAKQKAERETVLRKMLETIRSTIDINQMKKQIVEEIGKYLNVERCVIHQVDQKTGKFAIIDEFSEYMIDDSLVSYVGIDIEDKHLEFFKNLFSSKAEMLAPNWPECLNNLENVDQVTKEWINTLGIKSDYVFPIVHNDKLLASLYLTYTKKYEYLTDDDLNIIRLLSSQIAIALYQADLFEKEKQATEREKISKNIVEILRSTLDKDIIKHLFVINLGKFFGADRVFFSDYDSKSGTYLPIEKGSEYLSSPLEKSFVNFDFTVDNIIDFIKPLIEKRELNIISWDEYIKDKPKTQALVSRFENANVKSSYNLPVLYQEKIMGYFCIEYTHDVKKLPDEDINRIRNMCTQAGIALYHADLYLKAQDAVHSKAEFIESISNEFKMPLNSIVEFSGLLSKNDVEREIEIDYLDIINKNGRQLLEIADDIITVSEIESEKFMLVYEHFDSEQLIQEVINSIKLAADNKAITLELSLTKININADRKMLAKTLGILIGNAIKLTRNGGKILITSEINEDKLIISVENAAETDLNTDDASAGTSLANAPQSKGLGLSIAKKLIELHKGALHVESTAGKWSRYWFILPKAYIPE